MPESPCRNCTNRQPRCHSNCNQYNQYKQKINQINQNKDMDSMNKKWYKATW